jgi:hypothetical protein
MANYLWLGTPHSEVERTTVPLPVRLILILILNWETGERIFTCVAVWQVWSTFRPRGDALLAERYFDNVVTFLLITVSEPPGGIATDTVMDGATINQCTHARTIAITSLQQLVCCGSTSSAAASDAFCDEITKECKRMHESGRCKDQPLVFQEEPGCTTPFDEGDDPSETAAQCRVPFNVFVRNHLSSLCGLNWLVPGVLEKKLHFAACFEEFDNTTLPKQLRVLVLTEESLETLAKLKSLETLVERQGAEQAATDRHQPFHERLHTRWHTLGCIADAWQKQTEPPVHETGNWNFGTDTAEIPWVYVAVPGLNTHV